MKKFIVLLFGIFLLAGCSNTVPKQKSNLTVGMVKSTVVEGRTTQAEVMKVFGAPNLVTRNSEGEEVWNYNRMSFDSEKNEGSAGVGAAGIVTRALTAIGGGASGSRATSHTSTSSFDLILTFDENDVVKNYSVISSAY